MTEAARYASLSMGHDMLRQLKKSYEVDLPDLASVSRKKVSLDFCSRFNRFKAAIPVPLKCSQGKVRGKL